MARSYTLGIDLGTQSVKVVFYDPSRRAIDAVASAPLDLHSPEPGVAEQQSGWWLHALSNALSKVAPDVRKGTAAIGVSGQQHGFVAVDASGEVIAPVKLWCDTSTDAECQEIMQAVGGADACIDVAGNPILSGYTASKIRWLAKAHPDTYRRLDTILLPHDFLNFHLTGERCMEAGDASGTGLLDVRRRQWSAEMLAAVDPDNDLADCLPDVRTDGGVIGALRDEVAAQFGLPAGVPVSAGGGDNMMGAIGTGNVKPGVITMSLGTSGTVYGYASAPVIDPKGSIAAFCSSTGGWLPLLCTMNCTVTTELMRNLFAAGIDAFEQAVSGAPRGADGVVVVPYFNGERTPNLPTATGAVVGLTGRNTSSGNLMRAAVEGATYALRFGIDELKTLGLPCEEIVLTGGGSNSATWRQVVADVCELPVTMLDQTEGAAFGAALQALHALESGSRIEEITGAHLTRNESLCCEPSPSGVNDYRDGYGRYRRAAESIAALHQ